MMLAIELQYKEHSSQSKNIKGGKMNSIIFKSKGQTNQHIRKETQMNSNAKILPSEAGNSTDGNRVPWQHSLVFEIFSTVVVVIAAIGLFKVTGLYDAMVSTSGKVALGGGVAFTYLLGFRRGLYSK